MDCPKLIRGLGFKNTYNTKNNYNSDKKTNEIKHNDRKGRRPLAFAILTQGGEFEQVLRLIRALYNSERSARGENGENGEDGENGENGENGANGKNGANGADDTRAVDDFVCIHVDANSKDGTWEAHNKISQCLAEEEESWLSTDQLGPK